MSEPTTEDIARTLAKHTAYSIPQWAGALRAIELDGYRVVPSGALAQAREEGAKQERERIESAVRALGGVAINVEHGAIPEATPDTIRRWRPGKATVSVVTGPMPNATRAYVDRAEVLAAIGMKPEWLFPVVGDD